MPFTGLSDHCCIQMNIKINSKPPLTCSVPNTEDQGKNFYQNTYRYTYDPNKKDAFKENLLNDRNLNILSTRLAKNQMDQNSIDNCITLLDEALTTSARKVFPCIIKGKNKQKNKKTLNGWYTKKCKALRDALRHRSKALSNAPFNKTNRDLFVKARTAYKNTCRKAEKAHRKQLTKQLLEMGKNDPKMFWNIIDKMNNWGKSKSDPSDSIAPDRWIKHFSKLLNSTKNRSSHPTLSTSASFEPTLDRMISLKEMHDALSDLKPGKAPGPDGVLLEYLLVFAETFGQMLLKLLNKIFSEHIYPSSWTVNFLKPIFKKGEKDDTDNYRGLAIGSAFAKLFSQILLKRLTSYIEEKNLLSPNQGGFIKGKSTSDHIFLLQTVIEKVVNKGKRQLFAAFIDFKKAYDTVDRDLLLDRLKFLGINGPFLQNITAMYQKTMYSIKLNKGYLTPINSNLGLKQGCPLSPMLFNLYIDDTNQIFGDQCDPIEFQGG